MQASPKESTPELAGGAQTLKQVKVKRLRAPSPQTLQQEVDEWLAGVREGRILNKRERRHKPAVIRNYELARRLRVLPELGQRKLADIDLSDLLELKERLLRRGSLRFDDP